MAESGNIVLYKPVRGRYSFPMRIKLSSDKIQMFSYFILLCLAGSIALSLPSCYVSGNPVPYIDALFTSVSAVCVTGLSTVSMDVYTTAGFVVIMLLIEFGGLGLISFFALYILVPKRRISMVSRLVIRDFFIDDVESEPRRIVRDIVLLTLIIEGLGALFLSLGFRAAGSPRPVLDGAFHAVSAFCNAGFSTYGTSMESFRSNAFILIVLMLLIVSGGIGFTVLSDVWNRFSRRKEKMSFHSRIVLIVTAILVVFSALLFFVVEYDHSMKGFPLGDRVVDSFFQAITPRTAGFDAVPQSGLTPLSKLFTIMLMFIGGSPGSIAGGIKTTTFLIVFLYAIRGNVEKNGLNMRKRNVDTAVVEKAFSIFAKSMMIVIISTALLLQTELQSLLAGTSSFLGILFEVVSAFGTVGLSLGVTAGLSVWGKLIIILTMFIGRTGVFAMALGGARQEKERFFEYPSASIMVG